MRSSVLQYRAASRALRLCAVLLSFALVVAACGGDDDDLDSGQPSPAAEDTADGGEDTADGGEDTADGGEDTASDDQADTGSSAGGPSVGDHWHSAYGIYVCGDFVDPPTDESDPEGIHTHGDGIIHIHPFVETAAGDNATLGTFFDAISIELTDEGFFGATGSVEEGFECEDGPAEMQVARWSLDGLDEEPEIVETGVADIRFVEDLEVFTLALVAAGTEIPPPPWVGNLGTISDVDESELPQLPAGFSVASVPPPPAGETVDGQTPCPATDGSTPRATEFAQVPPMCIDPTITYTATFVTNYGDVVVELNTAELPETVNNFVVLARYGYYDDTSLFRTAPSIAIIQGGAPHTNSPSDPGPGYTIADEADGFTYQVGDLAMARTAAPDSASAQFFFSAGPATANLDGEPGNPDGSGRGTYVVFGRTLDGLDVLEEILGLHVEDPQLNGGGPGFEVLIETVRIEES
jgi:cyclophilin family peptidyl-prolyl cis-trans isomerase